MLSCHKKYRIFTLYNHTIIIITKLARNVYKNEKYKLEIKIKNFKENNKTNLVDKYNNLYFDFDLNMLG